MAQWINLSLVVALAPLAGAVIAGLLGRAIGRRGAHSVAILGVAAATVASGFVFLAVHVYTIGYMADDPGYQRFFAYISLFTFSMLMLVMSNNFLQLFFGWEGVGLMSYLLIGFWYERPSAIYASLKAFIVNRVGDLGFVLGIGLVFAHFGTLDYRQVFSTTPSLAGQVLPGTDWSLATVICICLFIGAMGKSAQFPLHVWLPDSMEGPTPISALIHAATMVTAGVFVTALYTFRMLFLVFHGKPRFGAAASDPHAPESANGGHQAADRAHDDQAPHAPHESPWVVTVPLVALAIPSVVVGYLSVERMLFSDFFAGSIAVNGAAHPAMIALAEDFRGPLEMALHSWAGWPLWLAAAGVVSAWFLYLKRPDLPQRWRDRVPGVYALLDNKYYMDRINEVVFGAGARLIGRAFWQGGDVGVIDGVAVNGSARLVRWIALLVRRVQTGYIYHYAFAMLVGVGIVLFAFVTRPYVMAAVR